MTFSELRVLVHPGDGIIAAFGSAIFACLPTAPNQEPAAIELLSAVERAAGEGPMPGRSIVHAAAELLGRTAPADVPPFAVLSPSDDGLAVMLQGDIELEVHQAGSRNVVSGREAITWVDRVIRGSFDRLDVRGTDGRTYAVDQRSRLDRGIVPGSGLAIVPVDATTRTAAPAAAPPATPPPVAPAPPGPPPIVAAAPPPAPPRVAAPPPGLGPPPVVNPGSAPPPPPPGTPPPAPPPPPPGTPPPAPPPPPPGTPPPVAPVAPPMPVAATPPPPPLATPPAPPASVGTPPPPPPSAPGAPAAPGAPGAPVPLGTPPPPPSGAPGLAPPAPPPTPAPVTPPPPPPPVRAPSPGFLVGDDGSRIDLDDNYILGREPFEHPDVTGGTARPFLFLDSESEISRAHTRVSVQGGQVTITDLKSANGTYIAVPGASEWQGLVPHTPVAIAPGTRILIGQRTFVYHAP